MEESQAAKESPGRMKTERRGMCARTSILPPGPLTTDNVSGVWVTLAGKDELSDGQR